MNMIKSQIGLCEELVYSTVKFAGYANTTKELDGQGGQASPQGPVHVDIGSKELNLDDFV